MFVMSSSVSSVQSIWALKTTFERHKRHIAMISRILGSRLRSALFICIIIVLLYNFLMQHYITKISMKVSD